MRSPSGPRAAKPGRTQDRLENNGNRDAFSRPGPFRFGGIGRVLSDVRGPRASAHPRSRMIPLPRTKFALRAGVPLQTHPGNPLRATAFPRRSAKFLRPIGQRIGLRRHLRPATLKRSRAAQEISVRAYCSAGEFSVDW